MTQSVQLSEWLELMLAEVARKHEELELARAEQRTREQEHCASPSRSSANSPRDSTDA